MIIFVFFSLCNTGVCLPKSKAYSRFISQRKIFISKILVQFLVSKGFNFEVNAIWNTCGSKFTSVLKKYIYFYTSSVLHVCLLYKLSDIIKKLWIERSVQIPLRVRQLMKNGRAKILSKHLLRINLALNQDI